MKRLILLLFTAFLIVQGQISGQTLSLPGGTINIGPILIGESSPDGGNYFTITGSGFQDETISIYVDVHHKDFLISLTGNSGTYISSLEFHPDVNGDVNQDIYVKYSPTVIGPVTTDLEIYENETWSFYYQSIRGIGKGPEMLLQGRPETSDPWLEISDGDVYPIESDGTLFGEALINQESIDRTYRIMNTQISGLKGDLNLDEYTPSKYIEFVSGDVSDFSVIAEPSGVIAPDSGSTTFTIRFEPATTGLKEVSIYIGNNDPDEAPYNFKIQGTGTVILPGDPDADAATSIDNNSFVANWTVGGAGSTDGYYLDVATDANFTNYVSGYQYLDVGDVTNYTVAGLNAGTDYYYRVKAYNAGGTSGYSDTISLTTASAVPTANAATNVNTNQFFANWTFVSGATSYRLDVNTQSDFAGTVILDDQETSNTYYNVTGLDPGNTYFYRVRSYNGNSSENSNIISVVTICDPPVANPAQNITHNSFTALWSAPAQGQAPDYYKLDVSTTNTFTSYVSGYENLTVSGTQLDITGLSSNTDYYYRVRAVNVSGSSVNSNNVTATTTAGSSTTWNGSVSRSWNDSNNWSDGLPGTITNVVIQDQSNEPMITSNAVCNDLTISPDASLTVDQSGSLTINGDLLIQSDDTGSGSFIDNGNVTYNGLSETELYLSENQWHLVTPPISDAVSGTFYYIFLKYFSEPDSTWNYITSTTENLNAGQGYAVWAASQYTGDTTVVFSGSLNTGDYNPTVTFNDDPGEGHGWNLLGNPYPSAIEWNTNWQRTDIDPTIYVFDGSQYVTWNAVTGIGTKGDGVIPAMQGFYVKANNNSPSLTIPDSERITDEEDFYKESKVLNNLMEITTTASNGYWDKTLILLNSGATEGFDSQFDAYKLQGNSEAPQLYSFIPGNILSVNALPLNELETVVPIGFEAGEAGLYSLDFKGMHTFVNAESLYLEDLKTQGMIDLNKAISYEFEYLVADDPLRFMLHINQANHPGNHKDLKDENKTLDVYSSNGSIYVQNPNCSQGEIALINSAGMVSKRIKLYGDRLQRIPVDFSGFCIVTVKTDSESFSGKIIIAE